MGNRKTQFVIGNFYHCYSRGIDKCPTFLEDADYWRFLETIHIANRRKKLPRKTLRRLTHSDVWKLPTDDPLVRITAYCLMPNHFHLLLEEIIGDGISTFMQKLMTGYTMYFNTKYDRSGGLFTSPFRSKHIHDDFYLRKVIGYIHLNPVGLIEDGSPVPDFKFETYPFSSLPDYLGQDRPQRILIGKVSPRHRATISA